MLTLVKVVKYCNLWYNIDMNEHELLKVWHDNVRANNIGGDDDQDGVTPGVAENIGYRHPADLGSVATGGGTIEKLESFDPAIGLTADEAGRLNAAARAERGGGQVDRDLLR